MGRKMEIKFGELFSRALKLLNPPFWSAEDFCHYTDIKGLIGIIENRELWLSDHRFVNDKREHEYGKQLAISVISGWMKLEDDVEFNTFLDKLRRCIIDKNVHGIYIGSMSRSPDKLDMWKCYGKGESVCIKFSGDRKLWNKGYTHPTHIRQHKIIYDETKQKELIEKMIKMYKNEFPVFKQFDYPFLRELTFLMESQFIVFKHKEYASENELRLTIENLNHILETKKPKYRVANSVIIPYISTRYISKEESMPEKLPITEIVMSPTSSRDSLESVKIFVANHGYTDVQVVESSIKFRG